MGTRKADQPSDTTKHLPSPAGAPAPKAAPKPTTRTVVAPVVNGNVTRLKAWPKSVRPEDQ